MRSYDEYKQILELWELGISKKAIARATGIPRATVRDCINRYGCVETLDQNIQESARVSVYSTLVQDGDNAGARREAYSYLLGLYLGDGNIVKVRNVYRLRITLDAKYPLIIRRCAETIQLLFPDNQIGIVETLDGERVCCVNVSLYSKSLLEIFPQHGAGHKHTREIQLAAWQQQIVDAYPLEFFRGLYHSDGSRFRNIVNGKDYPRYQFTNHSSDILHIFCSTCDRLGLHWTVKRRGGICDTDIFISKRKDVAFLDQWIGAKS